MNKINYNENKVLRSCILVQTLEKIGYNEEIPTITNYFLKYNVIDFEKAKTILSEDLKYILINMSVKQLNKFMRDYLSYYLNENISTDIIFEYNNFYYICFDYCSNKGEYTQITINEVKEFIIDFVNSIEEIEDYELIYEVILKGD